MDTDNRSGRSKAGQKGGRTTAERHRDDGFYARIGRIGGKARRRKGAQPPAGA